MLPNTAQNTNLASITFWFNNWGLLLRAAFAVVYKNRNESNHQQTRRKKQPLGDLKYLIESVYLDKRGVKIAKCIFTALESSKINKICYP